MKSSVKTIGFISSCWLESSRTDGQRASVHQRLFGSETSRLRQYPQGGYAGPPQARTPTLLPARSGRGRLQRGLPRHHRSGRVAVRHPPLRPANRFAAVAKGRRNGRPALRALLQLAAATYFQSGAQIQRVHCSSPAPLQAVTRP